MEHLAVSQSNFSSVCDKYRCEGLCCLCCCGVVADAVACKEMARELSGLSEGTHGHRWSYSRDRRKNQSRAPSLHCLWGESKSGVAKVPRRCISRRKPQGDVSCVIGRSRGRRGRVFTEANMVKVAPMTCGHADD
jgi:hypothetical protein